MMTPKIPDEKSLDSFRNQSPCRHPIDAQPRPASGWSRLTVDPLRRVRPSVAEVPDPRKSSPNFLSHEEID